jgi:hypothetical protein
MLLFSATRVESASREAGVWRRAASCSRTRAKRAGEEDSGAARAMLANVSDALKVSYARIVAARARQVALRAERIGQLERLVSYLRAKLADFLTQVDPISGARLLDVGAEESRGGGGFAVVLAGFDGSRLKIAVDALGHYTYASLPDVFTAITRIVEVRVTADLAHAEFDYVDSAQAGTPRTSSFDSLVLALLDRAAAAAEAEAAETT